MFLSRSFLVLWVTLFRIFLIFWASFLTVEGEGGGGEATIGRSRGHSTVLWGHQRVSFAKTIKECKRHISAGIGLIQKMEKNKQIVSASGQGDYDFPKTLGVRWKLLPFTNFLWRLGTLQLYPVLLAPLLSFPIRTLKKSINFPSRKMENSGRNVSVGRVIVSFFQRWPSKVKRGNMTQYLPLIVAIPETFHVWDFTWVL